MRPRVEVHIEELVLRGFPPLDRGALADAVERELGALLRARPPGGPADADVLVAGSFQAPADLPAAALGAGIAGLVGEALAAPAPAGHRDAEVTRT